MLHASKTPDESGNYNRSVRVTYRLGISMRFMKMAHLLRIGILFVMAVPMAAGYVPKPILYLDAANNPGHPKAWTNLGTAGGQLSSRSGGAKLGPNAGPDGTPAYTADKAGQSYGHAGISLFFEDWTIEMWVKRNGPASGGGRTPNLRYGGSSLALQTKYSPPIRWRGIRSHPRDAHHRRWRRSGRYRSYCA